MGTNSKSLFTTIGATGHAGHERQREDYYATDPQAVEWLLKLEKFDKRIWECACGEGHIAEVLKNRGGVRREVV